MYLKYCEKKDIDFLREKYSKEIEHLKQYKGNIGLYIIKCNDSTLLKNICDKLDYGYTNGTTFDVRNFYPAVYTKTIFDKIFDC